MAKLSFMRALEISRALHEAEVRRFAAEHGLSVEEAEEQMCLVEADEE